MRKLLFLAALTAALIAIPVAGASADYGKGAYRQIELSANTPGREGGGAWLWIELNRSKPTSTNGTGDYAGSDCGHGGLGAASDKGDVEWEEVGGKLVIHGVILNGFRSPLFPEGFETTVTVPAETGHYTGPIGKFLTLPFFIDPSKGNSQLQVAP